MQLVVFPENLYFCNNVPSASCDGGGGAQYELYGVGNHIGNSDGGHYTAFVKNATTKQWLHFNDEVIQNVPREQVVSPMAYCLFYRKIS
jgi:ubiquitin C-terminal hydrolase